MIDLSLYWARSEFDAEVFGRALGVDDPSEPWTVQASGKPSCHTHGRLRATEPADDEEEEDGAWVLGLETYRREASFKENVVGELPLLLDALASAATDSSECFVYAFVGLVFPSDEAEWRPRLLNKPPQITELKEDLGRISISGLKLRFEQSSLGLRYAELDSTPSTYATGLEFTEVVSAEELGELYGKILNKAEGFASLFIDFSSELDSEEE